MEQKPTSTKWARRVRYSPQEREEFVAAFQASGLTQKAFAQANGLNLGTFQQWLYVARRKPSQEAGGIAFQEMVYSPLGGSAWMAELSCSQGRTLRLSGHPCPKSEPRAAELLEPLMKRQSSYPQPALCNGLLTWFNKES